MLRSQQKEVVQRIKDNQHPVPLDASTRWPADLYAAEIGDGMLAAKRGYTMADVQMESLLRANRKPASKAPRVPTVGIGDEGTSFLLDPMRVSVTDYFERTSTTQASTHANKINDTFAHVRDQQSVDPVTGVSSSTGYNPNLIARELQRSMGGWTDNYANLISRTGVSWAQNEGAQQRYVQDGVVTHKRWYATADERTCPYCSDMHDRIVGVSVPFLAPNSTVTGTTLDANGDEKTVEYTTTDSATEHPPLHPMCRCTIIPEIENITIGG